jgi:hypothetical protein
MNVLEKILEEIKDNAKLGNMHWETIRVEKVEEIIRSHMDEVTNMSGKRLIDANDGWIPVSKRLPEVPEGTEDFYCPEFNVTIKDASKATTLKYAPDGTWFDDSGEVYNVMAWQPLPEPYRPEEE